MKRFAKHDYDHTIKLQPKPSTITIGGIPWQRLLLLLLGACWGLYFFSRIHSGNQKAPQNLSTFQQGTDAGTLPQFAGLGQKYVYDGHRSTLNTSLIENSEAMRALNIRSVKAHGYNAIRYWQHEKMARDVWGNRHGGRIEFAKLMEVFSQEINCPSMRKVGGLGENGKWICGVGTFLEAPNCVVYVFGTNAKTDFVKDMVSITPCHVHIFDPFLPLDVKSRFENLHKRISFHDLTVAGSSGTRVVFDGDNGVEDIRTMELSEIMEELGHDWVDVFTADVDGDMWEWFAWMFQNSWKIEQQGKVAFPLGQIMLNVVSNGRSHDVSQLIGTLMQIGFRIFHTAPNFRNDPPWENINFSLIRMAMNGGLGLRGLER
ncbi:hypothetical protein BSKO_07635 [Bryopsis sp. KO-2023]|nr:hypothetical protein BSKO_07635 [Bryopsis sp. KO-2023]